MISGAIVSGCATVFSGTSQTLDVKMLDETSQAPIYGPPKCSFTDAEGTRYVLHSNPGVLTLNRGNGPLTVSCVKEGYHPYSGTIPQNFNYVSLWDIFFWPTFIVDYASGAMHKYPTEFTAEMAHK